MLIAGQAPEPPLTAEGKPRTVGAVVGADGTVGGGVLAAAVQSLQTLPTEERLIGGKALERTSPAKAYHSANDAERDEGPW